MTIYNDIYHILRIQKRYNLRDNAPLTNGFLYTKYKGDVIYRNGFIVFHKREFIDIVPHIFLQNKNGDYIDACREVFHKGLTYDRIQLFYSYKQLIEDYPGIPCENKRQLIIDSHLLQKCMKLVIEALELLGKNTKLDLYDYMKLVKVPLLEKAKLILI